MKITLTLNGKDKEEDNQELKLFRNSLEDEEINLKISYCEVTVNLKDLEQAINYIKGNN